VDPLIGADWYGRVFVGSSLPFGMVKLGPDMVDFAGVPSKSGYLSAGRIVGFSHLHVSGTSGKYGNILVMPTTGPLDPADQISARSHESVSASEYTVGLSRYGVDVALTSTRRVGLHRYRFPAGRDAHVSLVLDHILNRGNSAESQRFLGGGIDIISAHEIRGYGRYAGGWNEGGEYRVFFDLLTDADAQLTQSWRGDAIGTAHSLSLDGDQRFGADLDFGTGPARQIQVKVGLSFVSVDQAAANIQREMPGWDFVAVRDAARRSWREALAGVQVDGATASQRRQLYTALYHSMLMPSDRSGENPLWQSSEPYYDDYYTIWDTFRTVGPLLTLIQPDRQRDMLRSLVDIYRHEGWMPDGRSGNASGRTQGGSNSDVLIADAYVKGLSGIDYHSALQAMLTNAYKSPTDARKLGRGGLEDYNRLGYVSLDHERAGSRTVEYAYDDFAIAELACGLGAADEAHKALARAGNWQNLWDNASSLEGVQGFIRPRRADGSWAPLDLQARGTWPDFFYEDDLWTYSLYAPQDGRGLIRRSGGQDAFVRRLDVMFDHFNFDMTNEPGFLIPMLYYWAGRPERSEDRVAEYLEKWFSPTRGGLPANDDSGAMSAWYAFQTLGLYPVAGQDVYLIGSPSYASSRIAVGSGKTLQIIAKGFTPSGLNRYVQSARLNGRLLNRAWLHHAEIAQGGELLLTLGSEPGNWGHGNPPPSLSDQGFQLCTPAPGD